MKAPGDDERRQFILAFVFTFFAFELKTSPIRNKFELNMNLEN